jgi:hypothetical protein
MVWLSLFKAACLFLFYHYLTPAPEPVVISPYNNVEESVSEAQMLGLQFRPYRHPAVNTDILILSSLLQSNKKRKRATIGAYFAQRRPLPT